MSNIQISSITLVNSWSLSSPIIGTGEVKILTVARMDGSSESFYLDEVVRKWLAEACAGGFAPQSIN